MGQEGWGHNETERNDFICVHICNIHIACLTNTKKSGFDFCRPIFVKTQGKLISPNIQGIDTDRVFGKKNLQATCQEFAREKTLCLKKAFLPETKPGAMRSRRRVVHARRKEKDNKVKVGKQLLFFILKSLFSLSHLRCPGVFGGTCIYTLWRK